MKLHQNGIKTTLDAVDFAAIEYTEVMLKKLISVMENNNSEGLVSDQTGVLIDHTDAKTALMVIQELYDISKDYGGTWDFKE